MGACGALFHPGKGKAGDSPPFSLDGAVLIEPIILHAQSVLRLARLQDFTGVD
jgi:hypothetical protein